MNIDYFNNYKLGIKFIDDEHYKLFFICDKIIKKINNKENVFELTNEFINLTKEHFKNEETYMEEIKFPYIKYHKEAHFQILIKLNNLLNIIENNDIFMQKHYIRTFDDSLLKHIDHYDFQISNFVNKK